MTCFMILLSGGIGSGKSIVARILRLKGFGVFDCDYMAKLTMNNDLAIQEKIKIIAREDVYINGVLDRKKLASIIFSDSEKRAKVNAVIHHEIKEIIKSWLKESPDNIFVETAIPVESGLIDLAEEVWYVEASEKVRIERTKARDHRTEDEIRRIMESQKKEKEGIEESKKPFSIISNDPDDFLLDRIGTMLENRLTHINIKISN